MKMQVETQEMCTCIDGATGQAVARSRRGEFVHLDIPLSEGSLRFDIAIPSQEFRLADIVPVCRALADRLSNASKACSRDSGMQIPCRKGCAACCSYLVPISAPEAFRLADELHHLPASQRHSVIARFFRIARRLLESGKTFFQAHEKDGREVTSDMLSEWYWSMRQPCPLLKDKACSNYANRPLACREHMVSSTPSLCANSDIAAGARIPTAVSVAEAMVSLTSELEGASDESIMLPLCLPWAQENKPRSQRSWPAKVVLTRLAGILHRQAALADSHASQHNRL